MMLFVIVLSVCVQVLLYLLFRRQRYVKVMILLLFLLLHVYLLPLLFTDRMYSGIEAPRCGMGAVFIYFWFWIFGGGITLLTHACYWLITRRSAQQKKIQNL